MGQGLGTGSWRLRNCLTGQGRGWEDSPLGRRRTALPPARWGDGWGRGATVGKGGRGRVKPLPVVALVLLFWAGGLGHVIAARKASWRGGG